MRLRPDRFCNFIYAWTVVRVEKREDFEDELLRPLPGAAKQKPSQAEVEKEGADFAAFASMVKG